jgi:hypothetical protein
VGTLSVEPLCILDHRVRQLRNHLVDQVKVQWDKYSPGSATWEDVDALRRDYPSLFLTTSRTCFFGFDQKSHSIVNRLSTFQIQIRIHLQDKEPGV